MTSEFLKTLHQEGHLDQLKSLSEIFHMLWCYEVEQSRICFSFLQLWLAPQLRFAKVRQHQVVIKTGASLAVLMGWAGSVCHHDQQGGTKAYWEEVCNPQ